MRAFLDAYLSPRDGEIVLADGTVLGHHDGIEHFTIGQRRGIRISNDRPLYVVELLPEDGIVVVGSREECRAESMIVDDRR